MTNDKEKTPYKITDPTRIKFFLATYDPTFIEELKKLDNAGIDYSVNSTSGIHTIYVDGLETCGKDAIKKVIANICKKKITVFLNRRDINDLSEELKPLTSFLGYSCHPINQGPTTLIIGKKAFLGKEDIKEEIQRIASGRVPMCHGFNDNLSTCNLIGRLCSGETENKCYYRTLEKLDDLKEKGILPK